MIRHVELNDDIEPRNRHGADDSYEESDSPSPVKPLIDSPEYHQNLKRTGFINRQQQMVHS